jgi:hypothetical protein
LVNTENSELRVSAAARHKHYQELADRLRKSNGTLPGGDGTNVPLATGYAGGVYKADKEDLEQDDSLVPATFALGQDDHPDVQEEAAVDSSGYDD